MAAIIFLVVICSVGLLCKLCTVKPVCRVPRLRCFSLFFSSVLGRWFHLVPQVPHLKGVWDFWDNENTVNARCLITPVWDFWDIWDNGFKSVPNVTSLFDFVSL